MGVICYQTVHVSVTVKIRIYRMWRVSRLLPGTLSVLARTSTQCFPPLFVSHPFSSYRSSEYHICRSNPLLSPVSMVCAGLYTNESAFWGVNPCGMIPWLEKSSLLDESVITVQLFVWPSWPQPHLDVCDGKATLQLRFPELWISFNPSIFWCSLTLKRAGESFLAL